MVRVTEEECIYLAGLIDGEGTITINKDGAYLCPNILISNTDLELLQKIKAQFGGKITRIKSDEPRWKPFYHFSFKATTQRWLLPKIAPYLRIKWRQAQILREYLQRTNRYRFGERIPYPAHDKERVKRLEELHQEIAELNVRGVENGE